MEEQDTSTSRFGINKDAFRQFLTYNNIIGLIVLVIGLVLLFYAFDSSMSLVIGVLLITQTWFIHVFYLIILACIGGFLVRQAMKVLGASRALATVFLVLGLIFLLQIFWTSRVFIETNYQLTLFVIFGIFFFAIMVVIFLFILMQGLGFFIAAKKEKKPATQQPAIQQVPVLGAEVVQQPREVPEAPLAATQSQSSPRICPRCLSSLSPEDTHCIHCGLFQESP